MLVEMNHTTANKLLPMTPSPVPYESVPGFLLKLAELNAYDSPAKLLSYSGFDSNEARAARPSLDKIGQLIGKSAHDLRASGLDEAGTSVRYLQVMGHSVSTMHTKSKQAGFCLKCVQENGYIDGFHELKYAVACPSHAQKTIQSCPACHKNVSWQRLGLTRCACGFDLSETSPAKVDHPATLALLGILYNKLMRQPLDQVKIEACGFPYAAIEQLSMQTLLSIIYRFGLFNSKTKDTSAQHDADWLAVQTTAEALSNWPHRFHDYIEQTHVPNANLKVSGLRGQFNSFYESFFKNIDQDQELEFMREAFFSFGQERWKKAAMYPKRKDDVQSNVVGINGLAKVTHIHPHTLRGLVAKGLIEINGRSDTAQPRDVFDLTRQQRFAFAEGKSLSVKKAAEMLDIPVEVLRAYRAQGLYQARYLAIPVVLFHERDVEQLKQVLLQDCVLTKMYSSQQHVTMAEVMRMKLSAEIKAAFIAEVKVRTIAPIGKLSDKPSGLVFDRSTANNHLGQIKNMLRGGLSFEQAKVKLQLDRDALLSLIRADVLQCEYQYNEMRVVEDSVLDFDGQFISCQEVARMKAITKKSAINLCHSLGVNIYQTLQVDLFRKTSYWIEKNQLILLGINNKAENHLKAA